MSEDQPIDPLEAAKKALVTASEHVARAQHEIIQASGGAIDFPGVVIQTQMVIVQFDALVEVLFESSVLDKIKFYEEATRKFRKAESQLRKTLLNMPKIQIAPAAPPTRKQ